jgi:lysozyme family protein
MLANFDAAFAALMGNEGGYVDDPNDPGGATRWGITQRVALAHDYHGDMRLLPQEIAKAIAKSEYWDACGCDDIADVLDFQVFDASYNSGPDRAKEWLAKALVPVANTEAVIMRFNAIRLIFLTSLSTWQNFGKGWARRIAQNLLRAAS